MDTATFTQYSISGNIGTGTSQDAFSITISPVSGATDASALALAQAIKDVPWPPGVSCMVAVFKSVQTTATSAGNLSTTPPVFA